MITVYWIRRADTNSMINESTDTDTNSAQTGVQTNIKYCTNLPVDSG